MTTHTENSPHLIAAFSRRVKSFYLVLVKRLLGIAIVILLRGRVAEVGRLSAKAKKAINSFVERAFPNSRQKNVVSSPSTKITYIWACIPSKSPESLSFVWVWTKGAVLLLRLNLEERI